MYQTYDVAEMIILSGKNAIGAWQLVFMKGMIADSVTGQWPNPNSGGSNIKMWSRNHFLFVGQFRSDTSISPNYGWGTYKLDGNRYEEIALYHVRPWYVGDTVKMLLEIKNDTLIQTFPVDDNGQINKSKSGYYILEKYIRLD